MHQRGQICYRPGYPAGEIIIGEIQHGESTQSADIGRYLARYLIPNQIKNSKKRQLRNARRDISRNALPVGYSEAGEPVQAADGVRDRTGHEPCPVCLFEDRVFGLATEVDVGDPLGCRVATDTKPVVAAVGSSPGVEYAKVGFVEGCSEG